MTMWHPTLYCGLLLGIVVLPLFYRKLGWRILVVSLLWIVAADGTTLETGDWETDKTVCGAVLGIASVRLIQKRVGILRGMLLVPVWVLAVNSSMCGLWHFLTRKGLSPFGYPAMLLGQISTVVVPIALFVLGFLYFWDAKKQSGRPALACRVCGYDLTGNVSGVCPECGKPTVVQGQ
ncbi:MAG TPA: hypothetical protein PLK04_12265 [Bacillota bacterium]|nr:hypothetical protein [Bacillota bacterium]HPZ14981.1 hypothetical protein [Bacillota bacterium]